MTFSYVPGQRPGQRGTAPSGGRRPVPGKEESAPPRIPCSLPLLRAVTLQNPDIETVLKFVKEFAPDDPKRKELCDKLRQNYIETFLRLAANAENEKTSKKGVLPEKAAEYLRACLEARPATAKNVFADVPPDDAELIDNWLLLKLIVLTDGFRRMQRGDENLNQLLGVGSMETLFPKFLREEILEPSRLFFKNTFSCEPSAAPLSYMLYAGRMAETFADIARKTGNDIFLNYLKRGVSQDTYRRYYERLRGSEPDFLKDFRHQRDEFMGRLRGKMRTVWKDVKGLSAYFAPKDGGCDSYYGSELGYYQRSLTDADEFLRYAGLRDKEEFLAMARNAVNAAREFLKGEPNAALASPQTQRMLGWFGMLLAARREEFQPRHGAALRLFNLSARTPFIPEEKPDVRNVFSLALQYLEQPERWEKAKNFTGQVVRENPTVHHALRDSQERAESILCALLKKAFWLVDNKTPEDVRQMVIQGTLGRDVVSAIMKTETVTNKERPR